MKRLDRDPVLSVCIPTCNRGPWLVEQLRAALRFAPEAMEIVVSDNASTDGTAEAVAAIDHPRLKLVRNQENVGAFENQLRAFEAASGRYVMQLMDKDELVPQGLVRGMAELARIDVACGEFALNGQKPMERPTTVRRGFGALKRHALQFTHPSGRFFSSETLRRFGLLARMRELDPVLRPYSTDCLVTMALRHGGYAEIDVPFVRMNLPPYVGLTASVSYRDPKSYYFTPESLAREFAAYVNFLRDVVGLALPSRLRLVSRLAGGTVLDQMTSWYRWRLESEPMCAWYGVSPDFRARELRRDLFGNGVALLRGLRDVGWPDRLAIRLGVAGRKRRKDWHEVPRRIRGEGT